MSGESAKLLYDKVLNNLAKRENIDESITILDSLLSDDIDPVSAYYLLGNVYTLKTHYAIAEQFFLKANELRPNDASIINALGCVAMELLRHHEAIDRFNESLAIKDDPIIYNNLATCYVHLGEPVIGKGWAEKAVKGEPDSQDAKQNLAQCLLGLGDYKNGFKLYESRLLLSDRKERFYTADHSDKYWDGTKGQTIIVHGEQGLGDEIMFASMLPDIMRDCNVVYDCNSRLLNIMRDSFAGIPIYGTKQQNGDVEWYGNHEVEAKVSIGSLAKFYRQNIADFPRASYLKADADLIEKYRIKMQSKRPKIGISWYGGAKRTNTSYRFNPLHNWLSLLKMDADFYSLQYNAEAGEKVAKFNEDNGTNIIHWQDAIDDYDDTAAMLMNLDLVISCPQSVVHLAGALGVKCWRLCAHQALWTHGVHGEDAPWYGSVKNYWQGSDCEWKPVMERVENDLKGFLHDFG
jgi:tetratricopeptide (TPR) repeat protein